MTRVHFSVITSVWLCRENELRKCSSKSTPCDNISLHNHTLVMTEKCTLVKLLSCLCYSTNYDAIVYYLYFILYCIILYKIVTTRLNNTLYHSLLRLNSSVAYLQYICTIYIPLKRQTSSNWNSQTAATNDKSIKAEWDVESRSSCKLS